MVALFQCGGDGRVVDTEDVAVAAFKLAPGRFAWRKYPEQINIELVRVSLSDAKKAEKGELVEGSGNTGWSLSPKGLEWAKEAAKRVPGADAALGRDRIRNSPVDEQRLRRERDRLTASPAWAQWSAGNAIGERDASDVFRIDSYAVGRMKSMKITRLKSLFELDAQISEFLNRAAAVLESAEPENVNPNS